MGRKSKERKAIAAGRQRLRVCDATAVGKVRRVSDGAAAESCGGNALSFFYRQKERRPKPPSFLVVNNH